MIINITKIYILYKNIENGVNLKCGSQEVNVRSEAVQGGGYSRKRWCDLDNER